MYLLIKVLLSFLLGSLTVLSFAPYDLPIFLLVGMLGYYCLIDTTNSKLQVVIFGFLFSIGFFGFGINWIGHSIYATTNSFLLAIFSTSIVVIVYAIINSCSALFYLQLKKYLLKNITSEASQKSLQFCITLTLLPASWLLTEIARLYILEGFPWLLLGYGVIDTPLSGYASIVGVLGLSLITCVLVALVYHCIRNFQYISSIKLMTTAIAVVSFIALGYFFKQLDWVIPTNQKTKVTIVQANIEQDKKWIPSYLNSSINTYKTMTRNHWDSDIILWPETAVATIWSQVNHKFTNFKQKAAETNTSVLFGVVTVDKNLEKGFYNSILNLNSGELYHKTHLVPFGERIPLQWLLTTFSRMLNMPMDEFTTPALNRLIDVAGYKVAASICFEIAFGREMAMRLPHAGFFVNVSNDAWFLGTKQPAQHLQIARMRAMELGRYIVRAANTGISAFINEKGQVLSTIGENEKDTLTENINIFRGQTFYAKFNDWTTYLILLVLVLTPFTKKLFMK